MTKAATIRTWACCAACLAMVIATAGLARAQSDESQKDHNQQQASDRSDSDQDAQRSDQDRDQQNRGQSDDQHRDRQSQQSNQQNRQWDQSQSQWQQNQSTELGRQQNSQWPQPNRDGYGDQQRFRSESDSQRQSIQQYDRGNDQQDAGLGVNILSDGGPGIIVARVFRGTPAEQMGIRPQDRITQVNGQPVSSVEWFIGRIRQMDPGDEVELEVLRDRNERIVRGELESRQEALVLNNDGQSGQYSQQSDDNRQTGYEQSGSYGYQQGGSSRSGDFNSRITSIEQQVNRLSRELEQIRFALQDLRQGGQPGRSGGYRSETQAGYNQSQSGGYQGGNQGEFQSGRTQDGRSMGARQGNQEGRFQESGFQGSGQSGQFNSPSGSRTSNEGGWDSEGGVTGGLRTRPDNDTNWADRQ